MMRSLSRMILLLAIAAPTLRAQWSAPTAAELSMTAPAEAPGAPAIVLWREQTSEDALHMWSYAESGKIANAAFSFASTPGDHTITLFRNLSVGKPIFRPDEYPEIRSFYARLYAGQSATLILTRAETKSSQTGASGN